MAGRGAFYAGTHGECPYEKGKKRPKDMPKHCKRCSKVCTCVEVHLEGEEKKGALRAISEATEEAHKNGVYGKYRIFDAVSGEEKQGRYFVLKLDAKDEFERSCVRKALREYAKAQSMLGNKAFAKSIRAYIKGE